jgi:hypothetical protein
MDLRALALRRCFDVVLLPYSLVTYLTGDNDLARALAGMHEVLNPGGLLVVDAFIPRPIALQPEFCLDYQRPFGGGMLARWKRIASQDPRINRIERRYQVLDRNQRVLEEIDVTENIRPFSPDDLRALVTGHGFAVEEGWWDYSQRAPTSAAQFFTLVARSVS